MTIDEVRQLIARAIWPEDIWTSDADEADRIIAEREATLDRILTALEAKGYVIVPSEPTDGMLAAADGVLETASEEDLQHVELRDDLGARVYRAMLAARGE